MKRSIIIVFIANVINMFFSVIISFILPKYLSIEGYGYYKTFQLYVNYVGIIHLGFADGVYLKYGGKQIDDISVKEILATTSTFRNMQLFFTVILLVIAISINNVIAICLSFSCFSINMVSYYKNLFQATGEFKKYGFIMVFLPMIACIIDLYLIFQINIGHYIFFIMVTVISNLLIYAFLELIFYRKYKEIRLFEFDKKLARDNIVNGFPLMVGNLASLLVTSVDRWFIQVLMTVKFFSYYSFAVSVENVFNICTASITNTLYNYLCKIKENEKIIRIKSFCIIIATYLISIAFPVKFVVMNWIDKYIPSINCIFVLIGAHVFYFVIRAVYVNLYKAEGKQKYYLFQVIMIMFVAIITNVLFYFVFYKSIDSIAIASLLSAIIWYGICYFEYKDIRSNRRECAQLFCCIIIYLVCGLKIENPWIGCLIYLVMSTLIIYFLNKKIFMEILKKSIKHVLTTKRRIINE